MLPNSAAPKGRATNGTAKTASVESTAAPGVSDGKKTGAITTVITAKIW